MFRVKSKGLFNGFVFRTFEFGICLAFRYYYFGFQDPYRIVHFIRKT